MVDRWALGGIGDWKTIRICSRSLGTRWLEPGLAADMERKSQISEAAGILRQLMVSAIGAA